MFAPSVVVLTGYDCIVFFSHVTLWKKNTFVNLFHAPSIGNCMQLTSYQSPRKKERLQVLKFNQTNSPLRYRFHHLRNTKRSAITALNIAWWPMVSPYRIATSKNLWIELGWLKILETKQNKKQMKTLKRWNYDSIPYGESVMLVEYDVWHYRIRKPPFFVRPQLTMNRGWCSQKSILGIVF